MRTSEKERALTQNPLMGGIDLLESNSIYISVHENQKNYQSTFSLLMHVLHPVLCMLNSVSSSLGKRMSIHCLSWNVLPQQVFCTPRRRGTKSLLWQICRSSGGIFSNTSLPSALGLGEKSKIKIKTWALGFP